MTLKEMLAARAAAANLAPAPQAPPAPPATVPGPTDRQLGTPIPGAKDAVVPMIWPHDPACADGNQLAVMIDEQNRGWLGILLPDERFLYLLGPLKSLGIPF